MADTRIVFDDGRGELAPMTDLRAVFEVRTGLFTTGQRLAMLQPDAMTSLWAPTRVAELVRERAGLPVNQLPDADDILCLNGRWVLPDQHLSLKTGEALVEDVTGDVVVARLNRPDAQLLLDGGELSDGIRTQTVARGALLRFPWEVIGSLKDTVPRDLEALPVLDAVVPTGQLPIVGDYPVKIHRSARVMPNVVLDATRGEIVVREHAVIRPGAVLCGPCAVDREAMVLDHALIKAHTVIGPSCKVAGEVGATVFQGFSNKAHDGHLGDSWVGKWVNLGAGTTNSNLLNTYSEVSMVLEPGGRHHRTGLTFLGTIFGDHVKTAICTRIMTGTVFGTGAMIATTAAPPTAVRAFGWLTDTGERTYRHNKFVEVMRAMMSRRKKEPSETYLAVLADVYERATNG